MTALVRGATAVEPPSLRRLRESISFLEHFEGERPFTDELSRSRHERVEALAPGRRLAAVNESSSRWSPEVASPESGSNLSLSMAKARPASASSPAAVEASELQLRITHRHEEELQRQSRRTLDDQRQRSIPENVDPLALARRMPSEEHERSLHESIDALALVRRMPAVDESSSQFFSGASSPERRSSPSTSVGKGRVAPTFAADDAAAVERAESRFRGMHHEHEERTQRRIEALQGELDGAFRRNQELLSDLREQGRLADEQIENLTRERDAISRHASETEAELARLQSAKDSPSAKERQMQEERDSCRAELDRVRAERDRTQRQLDILQHEHGDALQRSQELLSNVQEHGRLADERMEHLARERDSLFRKLSEKEADVARLQRAVDASSAKERQMQEEYDSCRAELDQARADPERAQRQIDDLQRERDDALRRNQELISELQEQRRLAEERMEHLAQERNASDALFRKSSEKEAAVVRLRSAAETLSVREMEMQEACSSCLAELDQARAAPEFILRQMGVLRRERDEAVLRNQELLSDLQETRRRADEQLEHLTRVRGVVLRHSSEKEAVVARLQCAIDSSSAKERQMQEECESCRAELVQAKAELEFLHQEKLQAQRIFERKVDSTRQELEDRYERTVLKQRQWIWDLEAMTERATADLSTRADQSSELAVGVFQCVRERAALLRFLLDLLCSLQTLFYDPNSFARCTSRPGRSTSFGRSRSPARAGSRSRVVEVVQKHKGRVSRRGQSRSPARSSNRGQSKSPVRASTRPSKSPVRVSTRPSRSPVRASASPSGRRRLPRLDKGAVHEACQVVAALEAELAGASHEFSELVARVRFEFEGCAALLGLAPSIGETDSRIDSSALQVVEAWVAEERRRLRCPALSFEDARPRVDWADESRRYHAVTHAMEAIGAQLARLKKTGRGGNFRGDVANAAMQEPLGARE